MQQNHSFTVIKISKDWEWTSEALNFLWFCERIYLVIDYVKLFIFTTKIWWKSKGLSKEYHYFLWNIVILRKFLHSKGLGEQKKTMHSPIIELHKKFLYEHVSVNFMAWVTRVKHWIEQFYSHACNEVKNIISISIFKHADTVVFVLYFQGICLRVLWRI